MPSSGKTLNLQLNKWLGSDKPKRDDFNSDNQKLEDAHSALSASVAQTQQSLSAHSAGAVQHITAAERSAWNSKDQSVTGTYQGDGSATRKITLGFAPRFGFLYAIGYGLIKPDFDMCNSMVYSGMYGSSGCSEGIGADSTGFTVSNSAMPRPSGLTLKLNEPGISYFYIAWR